MTYYQEIVKEKEERARLKYPLSCLLVALLVILVLPSVHSWVGTYPYRQFINCSNITRATPILLVFTLNATQEQIYTQCGEQQLYLYYAGNTNYTTGTNTTAWPFYTDSGTLPGYPSQTVFNLTALVDYYSWKDLNSLTGRNNLTNTGDGATYTKAGNNCGTTYCYATNTNGYVYKNSPIGLAINASPRTWGCWVDQKSYTGAVDNTIMGQGNTAGAAYKIMQLSTKGDGTLALQMFAYDTDYSIALPNNDQVSFELMTMTLNQSGFFRQYRNLSVMIDWTDKSLANTGNQKINYGQSTFDSNSHWEGYLGSCFYFNDTYANVPIPEMFNNIKGYSGYGNLGATENVTIIVYSPPNSTTVTKPSNITYLQNTTINITWTNATDPANLSVTYNVSLWKSGVFQLTINTSTPNLNLSYNLTTAVSGGYQIGVKPCNSAGLCNDTAYSSVFSIVPPTIYTPSEVTVITPINTTYLQNSTLNISWTPATDDNNFTIYYNVTLIQGVALP